MDSDPAVISLLKEIRGDVAELKRRMSEEPTHRYQPYTVAEFAAIVRRSPRFIADRCSTKRIRTLPGKPYRIPVSELIRYLKME